MSSNQPTSPKRRRRMSGRYARPTRRGSILVVTMWITIGLAAMVLVLAEAMRVEMVSSANEYSALQAQAVEEGAQRYVLSQIGSLGGQVPKDADVPCEAVRVGQGAFWIIRPDPDSAQTQTISFGLVDEASKANLNGAPVAVLGMLPDMTTQLADCIADWRDKNSHTSDGAKSDYYMMLNPPYQCKEAPFETVEELLLVKDITRDILFGQDANRNGVQDTGETVAYGQFDRGVYPFVTAFSNQTLSTPPSSGTGTPPTPPPPRRLINIITAPKEVLAALPGLNDSDVAAIMAKRLQSGVDLTNLAWVTQTLNATKFGRIYALITTVTYQFSADIVSVAGDGRAFKRCRIVVDNRKSPARIIYRQDLTSLGWPLSPDIISGLRAGKSIDQAYQPVSNVPGLSTH